MWENTIPGTFPVSFFAGIDRSAAARRCACYFYSQCVNFRQVIFSKGYGVTSLATKNPVTPRSLFGLASVSKGFAATLLVKLLYEKTK